MMASTAPAPIATACGLRGFASVHEAIAYVKAHGEGTWRVLGRHACDLCGWWHVSGDVSSGYARVERGDAA